MTITELKNRHLLLFEAVSGSHAYGLQHKDSDVDLRGVFVMPKAQFYGLTQTEQVSDARNDEVYYELKKFVDMLVKNKPNFLEVLATPADCIRYQHPLFERLQLSDFLSKQAKGSFAGYALSQVKKARGLKKKIVNPMSERRKSVLEFCYVQRGKGAVPLLDFLAENNFQQANCGLVNVAHMKGIYALFHSPDLDYQGIIRSEKSNDICLSSVPKGEQPVGTLYFNKDGYSTYCKEHTQYWEWVQRRNQARYESTMHHGKNYDAKNMMHTFRLLHMAAEIARTGTFSVRRTTDKTFLWKVRMGEFSYDDLVQMTEDKIAVINELFEDSNLPEKPDLIKANNLLLEIRDSFYNQ
ncbi:MAG: nucleotidyltransferase domain-containing protein [Bacteroidota bacterium]